MQNETRVQNDDSKKLGEGRANGVRVISRAVSILRILKEYPDGLTLSQIAKQVSLPRSTVHRMISALEAERLIAAPTETGQIQLGMGLASLVSSINLNLRRELRPHLEHLYAQTNETIDLAFLDGNQVVLIDQIMAPHRLRAVSGIGVTFPLYCSANGKALLANLSKDEAERLIPDELAAFTPNTITSRQNLLAEIEHARTQGVAFDREEHTIGICAVGAAVTDPMGRLAAISIAVPKTRFEGSETVLSDALRSTIIEVRRRFDT